VNEKQYLRLRRQIEDDYKKKLDALETVWRMVSDPAAEPATSHPRQNLMPLVRDAVATVDGPFTQTDLQEQLAAKNPSASIRRSSLASALRRLVDEGVLEIVERGVGKKPSIYRHKST